MSTKEVLRFDEAKKVWQQFARNAANQDLTFELEVHKKLLNLMHVGECYYYVFNLATTQIEVVSDSVATMLCLDDKAAFTTDYVLQNIHPNDLPVFIDFERRSENYTVSLQKKNYINTR